MSDIAIRVEDLSKQYRIGAQAERYKTLRDTLAGVFRINCGQRSRNGEVVWALKDVSFEVRRGEVMGIIGRNGAGKSTLLKILSRITEPTNGYAEIRGRVGSLLEVGTGFHPELTGRENIYLNGAILGMRRGEIEAQFEDIVAFAEVQQFIDTPVKHYSSGMYLRLAFAVAAHLNTDILVVDEVLAVGDISFQRKCLAKMQRVSQAGRTVIFVSHDMTAIASLTSTAVLLHAGQLRLLGSTEEVIGSYTSMLPKSLRDLSDRTDRTGDGMIRVLSIYFLDHGWQKIDAATNGQPLTIALQYTSSLPTLKVEAFSLDLRITDILGHPVATLSTRFCQLQEKWLPGCGTLFCTVHLLALAPDLYTLDVWVSYRGGHSDFVARAAELTVLSGNYFGSGQEPVRRKHGPALLCHSWSSQTVNAEVTTQ